MGMTNVIVSIDDQMLQSILICIDLHGSISPEDAEQLINQ